MRPVHRAAAVVFLLAATARLTAAAPDPPLAWANGLRAGSAPAVAVLAIDPVLSAAAGKQQVWVVMLARSVVAELALEDAGDALRVSGRLGPAGAVRPWLRHLPALSLTT